MVESGVFVPYGPKPWQGRYCRIPGDEAVFHIRSRCGFWWPMIQWTREGETGTCWAEECDAARLLAEHVNRAKRLLCGTDGGSYLVNEFGQVIVPATDGAGERLYIGKFVGKLLFHDPFNGGVIDISDDKGLTTGDEWAKPYLGCRYHLSAHSQIYSWNSDVSGGWSERPQRQDKEVIKKLRSVRRWGPLTFVVNQHGIVLCKKPPDGKWDFDQEDQWDPVYIGRIDYNRWFEEEE